MRLYLMRHATPNPPSVDPEKSLSEVGINEAGKVAEFVSQNKVFKPQYIYHSGKARARQTAEIVAKAIGLMDELQKAGDLSPNDDPQIWAGQLKSYNDDIALVGHLPFMARIVSLLLLGNASQPLIEFEPATMVCLEFYDGRWYLQWVIKPSLFA